MTPTASAARKLGAIAGLAPMLLIGLLFVLSGSLAPPGEVAMSLAAMAAVSMMGGWLAGPFAVGHGWIAGACAYGAVWMIELTGLAVLQTALEVWSTNGLDVGAIAVAVIGRAAYALISVVYFFVPAIAFGAVWAALLRIITRPARRVDASA
jgi:hypothetical protein